MKSLKELAVFTDITEPFEFVYPKQEEIGGVIYEHVSEGLYRPQQRVEISEEEFEKLLKTYPDVLFFVDRNRNRVVIYCVSSWGEHSSYMMCLLNKIHRYESLGELKKMIGDTYLEGKCWFYSHHEQEGENCITGLCQFQKVDESNTYQGYPKHIQLKSKVGYLIEPGIYYFGNYLGSLCEENPELKLNQEFDQEMAAICYSMDFHPSLKVRVTHLAVGEENFARLEEIQRTKDDSFLHVFKVANKKAPKVEVQPQTQASESEAVELLEGLGVKDIWLGYQTVFSGQIPFRQYDMAYILNDKLVLHETEALYEWGITRPVRNEVDLKLIGELTVRVETELNCGIKMERDIKVIECKKEKEQELLNAEKLRFGELRGYLSRIDRFSMCMLETLEYKNYTFIENVPKSYDDFYVIGIGVIESEFCEDSPIELATCMEIMLSEKPKKEAFKNVF